MEERENEVPDLTKLREYFYKISYFENNKINKKTGIIHAENAISAHSWLYATYDDIYEYWDLDDFKYVGEL